MNMRLLLVCVKVIVECKEDVLLEAVVSQDV